MAIETATARRGETSRRIRLPGGEVRYESTRPEAIARDLRLKSKLGRREARLEAAAKHVK